MRRFAWIVTLPIIAVVAVFAVDNRQAIELELWPLPWALPAIPLYLFTLCLILFGFVIGVLVMWFTGGRHRRQHRALKRDLDDAKMELHTLRRQAPQPQTGTALAVTRKQLPPAA